MKRLKYFILVLLLTMQVNSAQNQLILFETGSGDRPYKVYTALLTQSGGTDAPVATVLENTIGNIVWTYISVGVYRAVLTGGFPTDKVFMIPLAGDITYVSPPESDNTQIMFTLGTEDYILCLTYDPNGAVEGLLNKTPIEIRVYP